MLLSVELLLEQFAHYVLDIRVFALVSTSDHVELLLHSVDVTLYVLVVRFRLLKISQYFVMILEDFAHLSIPDECGLLQVTELGSIDWLVAVQHRYEHFFFSQINTVFVTLDTDR